MMLTVNTAQIARLSWCAHVTPETATAVVGPWVETGDGFLVEGAWPGNFSDPGFDQSFAFFGSGITIRNGKVVVVSPCHTFECVYSVDRANGYLFSNSLALLLKMAGEQLDVAYLDYEHDALSISLGLNHYVDSIPLMSGKRARRHYYCNITVGSQGELLRHDKPKPSTFVDFAAYSTFLRDQVKAIHRNATDTERTISYEPIVFCSNGYDSPACAALGKEIGANEAVVFESKKSVRSDTGKSVVQALGYATIHEKEELDYLDSDYAHEFLGTGELATSIFFAAAREQLEQRMLLSGVHGDKMWDRNHSSVSQDIRRSAFPDTARHEFRLATGYLCVAPAFLTVSRHTDVNRISNSKEMEPWQLGTSYDRPIPRRIVEEAGVPRTYFGIMKEGGAGSSLRFGTIHYLRRVMPSSSFQRFDTWRQTSNHRRSRMRPQCVARGALYIAFLTALALATRGYRQLYSLLHVKRWPLRLKNSVFAPSLLFPWAIYELQRTNYRAVEADGFATGSSTEAVDVDNSS